MYTRDEAQRSIVTNLCRNLFELRRAHALTQSQLGEAAGITRNHYQLLEQGRTASGDVANPRLSTLLALGRALNVEANTLLLPPRPFTAWFWIALETPVEDNQVQSLFRRLMDASEAHLSSQAGAFVGPEDRTLTVGIGVLAPTAQTAEVIAHRDVAASLTAIGLDGTLDKHREVQPGTADLATLNDA